MMLRYEDYTTDERMEEGYLAELTQAVDEPKQSPEEMVAEAKQRLTVVIAGGKS